MNRTVMEKLIRRPDFESLLCLGLSVVCLIFLKIV